MKKKIISLIITLAVLATAVSGCGTSAAAGEKVKNNGGYFVEVDGKIYYRSYPIGTLEDGVLGGSYMGYSLEKKTDVMCYDPETGETTVAFSDKGNGEFYYLDDRFYMAEGVGIYSCKLDGSDYKKVESDKSLFSKGCDDLTQTLVAQAFDEEGNATVELWQKGEYKVTLNKGEETTRFITAGEGFVVYAWGDSEVEQKLGVYDLQNNREYSLGKMPSTETKNGFDIFDNCVINDGKVYIACGNIEGSMNVIYECAIISAELDVRNSVKVETVVEYEDLQLGLPYIIITDKGVEWTEKDENHIEISGEGDILGQHFTDNIDPEGTSDAIEAQAYIDGNAYIVVNTQKREPAADVGWRAAYTRMSTRYIKVDMVTGKTEVLSEVK